MSQLRCGYESFDMEGVKLSVCACTAKLELMKKKPSPFSRYWEIISLVNKAHSHLFIRDGRTWTVNMKPENKLKDSLCATSLRKGN